MVLARISPGSALSSMSRIDVPFFQMPMEDLPLHVQLSLPTILQPEGIQLVWWTSDADTQYTPCVQLEDGWEGVLPGQALGTMVSLYLDVLNSLDQVLRLPADAPESVYRVTYGYADGLLLDLKTRTVPPRVMASGPGVNRKADLGERTRETGFGRPISAVTTRTSRCISSFSHPRSLRATSARSFTSTTGTLSKRVGMVPTARFPSMKVLGRISHLLMATISQRRRAISGPMFPLSTVTAMVGCAMCWT